MALALHSRWMGVKVTTIHATGGAAANRDILQVMADVFGADVYQFEVGNSACLGAALRAFQADGFRRSADVVGRRGQGCGPVAATRVADPARHPYVRRAAAHVRGVRTASAVTRVDPW